MTSDDANDGFCAVTICDVTDDDVANVNSLNLSNWLKAVLVAGVVAILGILLLSTHHSMLLILIREMHGQNSDKYNICVSFRSNKTRASEREGTKSATKLLCGFPPYLFMLLIAIFGECECSR